MSRACYWLATGSARDTSEIRIGSKYWPVGKLGPAATCSVFFELPLYVLIWVASTGLAIIHSSLCLICPLSLNCDHWPLAPNGFDSGGSTVRSGRQNVKGGLACMPRCPEPPPASQAISGAQSIRTGTSTIGTQVSICLFFPTYYFEGFT